DSEPSAYHPHCGSELVDLHHGLHLQGVQRCVEVLAYAGASRHVDKWVACHVARANFAHCGQGMPHRADQIEVVAAEWFRAKLLRVSADCSEREVGLTASYQFYASLGQYVRHLDLDARIHGTIVAQDVRQ